MNINIAMCTVRIWHCRRIQRSQHGDSNDILICYYSNYERKKNDMTKKKHGKWLLQWTQKYTYRFRISKCTCIHVSFRLLQARNFFLFIRSFTVDHISIFEAHAHSKKHMALDTTSTECNWISKSLLARVLIYTRTNSVWVHLHICWMQYSYTKKSDCIMNVFVQMIVNWRNSDIGVKSFF